MKREVKNLILLVFIALILLIPVKASAADESSLSISSFGDECIITDCVENAEGVLIIPSEISGVTVTTIGKEAFKGCKQLTEVILPDTVTDIGSNAFSGCVNLKRLTMSDSVTELGEGAFFQCKSLEEVVLSDNIKYILNNTFNLCSSLKSVNIPKLTHVIYENAFTKCSSLKSVILPEGLLDLSARCFLNCTSLSSVYLPSSVENIGAGAFENCSSLNFVYYEGDERAFEKITILTGNNFLENADIKPNHDHLSQAKETVYKPDCLHKGYSVYNCVCGYVSEGNYVSALGHKPQFKQTLDLPTCTDTGRDLYKCIACDYTEVRITSAKGHNSVADNKIAATCTIEGKTSGSHCSSCGKIFENQDVVPALGHDFSLKIIDSTHLASKATYKNEEKYFYSCSRCNEISKDKTFSGEKLVLPNVKTIDYTAGTKSVKLKWNAVSDASGYEIYKKDENGKYSLVNNKCHRFEIEADFDYGSYLRFLLTKYGNPLHYDFGDSTRSFWNNIVKLRLRRSNSPHRLEDGPTAEIDLIIFCLALGLEEKTLNRLIFLRDKAYTDRRPTRPTTPHFANPQQEQQVKNRLRELLRGDANQRLARARANQPLIHVIPHQMLLDVNNDLAQSNLPTLF